MDFATEQVKAYVKDHSVSGQEKDLRAWALCAYQVTFNPDYSHYVAYDWTEVDLQTIDDRDPELDLLEDPEEIMIQEELDAQEEKLLSYPWIFGKRIAELKGNMGL